LAADPGVEQKIQHVEGDILPPVMVAGEPRDKIKLIDRMAELKVPALSIAVIHNGRIEWARGYGVRNTSGARVTPDTLFQAASISKTITALATLRIAESGKLDLDKDVNFYLKSWKVPANTFTDQTKVTLRELLSHTAGLTVHGFAGYASSAPLPTLLQVLDGTPPANSPAIKVDSVPGTRWRYSGGGYVVIQQLLEDVTGQPFAKLVKDTVLIPIGMNHSTFDQPLPDRLLAGAAMPFDSNGKPLEGGPHSYPERAPAGLWTTPSDLARYALEVQKSLAGHSKRVLSQQMTQQMLTPGMNNWGLGPNTGGKAPHQYFEHGGANAGYQCELIAFEDGDGAVLMTNSDNGNMLISEVVGTIAHEYAWPDLQPTTHTIAKIDPKSFDLLVGSYRFGSGFILTFTREGDRYLSQATHQGQIDIYPENERQYFAKAVGAQMTFQTDAEGRGKGLTLHQGNRDMQAQRLDDAAGKVIAEELAAVNRRVRDQVATPGSEEAVRRLMIEIAAGKPDYARMSPMLSDVIREQLEQLQKVALQLGSVQSVTFHGVRPDGADLYRVGCEHGVAELGLSLSPDGKIDNATFALGN
jgi:CubicO group peptidase (beta-lactamase class C family)